MATTSEKLLAAFTAARDLNLELWQKVIDPASMSIDDLHAVIEAKYNVRIALQTIDVEMDNVWGFIERYDHGRRADIYIVKNIPERWKRAVAAKELCHVVLDFEDDWNKDGLDTLQRLGSILLEPDAPENAAVRSEQIAEICAWELLYPHEFRGNDKAELDGGVTTIAALAARYQLPEEIIEEILTPPYLRSCDKYWRMVSQ